MIGAVVQALRPDYGLQGKAIDTQVNRMKWRALTLALNRTRNRNSEIYSMNSILQSHNGGYKSLV